jgi:hypothetical protein
LENLWIDGKMSKQIRSSSVIGKTALSEPQEILSDLSDSPSSFHSFEFRNNNFYRARSLALRPTPNLEDQVPVFMSPSDSVIQLYPQAAGSLFVAFYDSQGYGGGILARLHTGLSDHILSQ